MNTTNLTKEEQLDIMDYFLQYKPESDNNLANNEDDSTTVFAGTFFRFIYENGLMPRNYIINLKKIKESVQ